MFNFISKKKADEDKIAHGKAEYYRGAEDASRALKQKEDEINVQKSLLLNDWATLKEAKKEFEQHRAKIVLEGMREVFTGTKPTE